MKTHATSNSATFWSIALVALCGSQARAEIRGPYTPDADTLHLWHFDEAASPVADSAGAVELFAGNGATLGGAGFAGFGNAGDTSADDDAEFLSVGTRVPPVGEGGAFTYEALIKVSTISADIQQIFAMEGNGGASERPFQFRVRQGELQFINIAGASGVDGDNNATIPTTGPDAFVPNEWFHVAVTYDGNENTADNLKLYWTRVDAARTGVNLIGSFTLVDDLTTANTTVYGVGNDGRTGVAADKNIEGLIDEVRISGTARSANQFIFFDPADAVPPQLVSVNPPDDATGVWTGTNLVAAFDEPVEAGSGGVIEIRRTSDNVTVESFDVTSSPRLSFGGTSVTIDPADDLSPGVEYHVLIDNTAVTDLPGNEFAGIADPEAWSFTTDGTPPTASGMGPMAGAAEVSPLTGLELDFDEPVQIGSGTVTIHLASDDGVVQSIDVTSGAVVLDGAGAAITLEQLAGSTDYYVNISSGAFTDPSGNAFPGISDSSTWIFTTAPIPEGLLFSHDFGGDSTDLDGVIPDVTTGAALWVASPNFNRDGSTDDGPGSATLTFTPFGGKVYTLEASYSGLSALSGDLDWFALGFVNGQSNLSGTDDRFITGNVVGAPWMMIRGDVSLGTNQSFLGNGQLGGGNNGLGPGGVNNGVPWSLSPAESAVDMRIILDTTGGPGAWTATWFVKNAGDTAYTEVRPTEVLHDPTAIGSVGLARSNPGVTGTVESFRLYTGSPPQEDPLVLKITSRDGALDFEWNSMGGMRYDLVSSTDLSTPISSWPPYDDGVAVYEDIETSGTGTNTLSGVLKVGPKRFFALIEEPLPPLLAEDFESVAPPGPPPGWAVDDNGEGTAWSVGTPDGTGTEPDAAANGDRCAGTNMNGDYTSNAEASLVTAAFTVPDSGATLDFSQYIDTELASGGGDFGSIRLLNAADDSVLAGGDVASDLQGISEAWTNRSLPLPAAANGLSVKLEFRFTSNASSQFAGFYIDDVVVTAN